MTGSLDPEFHYFSLYQEIYYFSIILLLIFLRLGISRFDLASLCIVVSLRNDSACAHKPTYYCLNAVAHISFSLFFFSVDYFSHLIDLIFLS